MVPPCSDRISRVPPYSRTEGDPYPYGAVTHFGATFQNASGSSQSAAGLVRVRSPLLTESRLMSFPPVTEMFQFTGFASRGYGFTARCRRSGGLPHSEIPGSKPARGSPGLIAACYVLHRLSTPRHPPNALLALEPRDSMHRRQPAHSPRDLSPSDHARAAPPEGAIRAGPTPDLFTMSNSRAAFRRRASVLPEPGGERRGRPSMGAAAGGGERNRTDDLLLAKQALSRLSYAPGRPARRAGGPG